MSTHWTRFWHIFPAERSNARFAMDICVGQTVSESHHEGCPGRIPFLLCVFQCTFNANPDSFPLFHHNGELSARFDEQAIWQPVSS